MTVTRMQVVHYDEKEVSMNTGLKVAFATTDMNTVNQHFGSAKSFAIYSVSPDQAEFVEAAQFGKLDQDGNEAKLAVKFDLLKECAAVYCQAVGASAVRQMVAYGIQPVKVSEGSAIDVLIADLQAEMKAGPSAWLARAMKQNSQQSEAERFDEMADEDWSE